MTIALHYCGKSIQDVAIFGKGKPCCGGMEMPSGCCHDEKVEIKSDNFSIAQQIVHAGFVSFLIYEMAYPVLDFSLHFQNSQSHFLAHFDKTLSRNGPGAVPRSWRIRLPIPWSPICKDFQKSSMYGGPPCLG